MPCKAISSVMLYLDIVVDECPNASRQNDKKNKKSGLFSATEALEKIYECCERSWEWKMVECFRAPRETTKDICKNHSMLSPRLPGQAGTSVLMYRGRSDDGPALHLPDAHVLIA